MEEKKNPGAEGEQEQALVLTGRQELLAEMMDQTMHYLRSHYSGKGGQGRALRVLNKHGAMTQQELQNRLNIQPSSISEILAKLEGAGFITRTRDETDRRRQIITITPEGQVDLEKHEAARIRRQSVLYASLSDEEQEELIRLLVKLWEDWDDKDNPTWNSIKERILPKTEEAAEKNQTNGEGA